MLNADELGEKGQSRFRELCADAQLTCNEAWRDRTGWDFIVEFPFPPTDQSTPIDSRSIPLSCHIQVKTLLARSDTIKLRLSSAERLAKEVKPSFIYIFKTLDSLIFSDSILIHILDEPLATILKRLRQERAAGGQSRMNHQTISLSANRYGVPLRPTGAALREAIEHACGSNSHDYSDRKKNQLQRLRFEKRALKATFRLRVANGWEDAVDAFLGLKEHLPVVQFEAYEERFGIALPIHQINTLTDVTITVKPEPIDRCEITIRHPDISLPAVIDGNMYFPALPGIPSDHVKVLVECDQLRLTVGRKTEIVIETEKFQQAAHTVDEWATHARMLLALASGGASVDVSPHERPGMALKIKEAATGFDQQQCARWLRVCENLADLCKKAGASSDLLFRLDDIENNSAEIGGAAALLQGKGGEVTFTVILDEGIDFPGPCQAMFIRSLSFGDHLMTYYGTTGMITSEQVTARQFVCKSNEIVPGGVRFLRKRAGEFDTLVKQLQEETKAEMMIITE